MGNSDNFVAVIPQETFTEKGLIRSIQNCIVPHNAISWSAENGYLELTKSLLALGAPVNENRNYPLELASRNGHTEIVKILLEAGANTCDSSNDEGYCLRQVAIVGILLL